MQTPKRGQEGRLHYIGGGRPMNATRLPTFILGETLGQRRRKEMITFWGILMIDGKAAVMIACSLAGAIACWAAVYGWGKWLARPKEYFSRDSFDSEARLQRIEHAVEAIAVEVERIGEGLRYNTKLLAERDVRQHEPIAPLRPPLALTTPH